MPRELPTAEQVHEAVARFGYTLKKGSVLDREGKACCAAGGAWLAILPSATPAIMPDDVTPDGLSDSWTVFGSHAFFGMCRGFENWTVEDDELENPDFTKGHALGRALAEGL